MKTLNSSRKSKRPAKSPKPSVSEVKPTRSRILEAARQLFAEMPYDKVVISGIVKRAAIAQGTFYLHFDSKQAVVHALADEMLTGLQGVLDRAARETRTTIDFIALMIRQAPEAVLPYQAIMRILDPETLFFQTETTPSKTTIPLLDTLIQLIRRDQRSGVIAGDLDAPIAARFIVSILDRIGRDGTQQDPAFKAENLQKQVLRFLSRALNSKTTSLEGWERTNGRE